MLLWNLLKHYRLTKLFSKCSVSFPMQYSTSGLEKIKENSFKVHPGFGKLLLKSQCNCTIRPADPQIYPDADHAKIIHWGIIGKSISSLNAELVEKNSLLKLEILENTDESHCEIFIPMKYDIEADMEGDASLEVQHVESDNIHITSSRGSITTKNIKTEEMSVSVEDGVTTLDGNFQGNLLINAKKLVLKAKRLQGTLLCVQADNLTTDIESSYMIKGNIFAKDGNLYIKNLHGSTDIHLCKGELCINGLHGRLQSIVNEGTVDVHVSQVTDLSLIQLDKGSLQLSYSDLSDKRVVVSAPSLEMNHDVESLGSKVEEDGKYTFNITSQSAPVLHANVACGHIKIFIKDWFSSLGIKTST